ncbi:auxin-responsive protein SAUR71-like [Rhodamnia argentea]|uniref:Auxin-responsive protein SAUR71-like n=1 Tax=Rhodamnia argentea TaxID=178133 RepID=A0A8B8QZB6_9MYRT|nr:auxin-responsive protein SAUR71-like [Rhodamnia argentea]
MESPEKSNKIREVVRLRRLLKKWRNFAKSSKAATSVAAMSPNRGSIHKGINFLKRSISSLSSDDDDGSNNSRKHSSSNNNAVPRGYLAVCVGEELQRFVIPMHYLDSPAFGSLLQEAEEVFGFQQTGVLRIPCNVSVFGSVLDMVERE